MKSNCFSYLLVLAVVSAVSAYPSSHRYATILERAEDIKESYDYVIVGGGTAGLTVGDRLTADGKYTVLVIENGEFHTQTGMSANRMYSITSTKQPGLQNRTFSVGIGNMVGGSSGVNGMVFQRGTKLEYNMWKELGSEGSTWDWNGILPYFKKGIHFNPPPADFAEQLNVTYDPSVWAQEEDTRIYATFSTSTSGAQKFMYNAYKEFGIDAPLDGNAGTNGLTWFTTSMDPTGNSRSYARTGHWDGINRSNYELITGSKVNKILFDGTTATGVQFIPATGQGVALTVKAKKEVILAAGAVHTPQVLQLSGIGPSALLKKAKIPVLVDLGGVGYNFHDHTYISGVSFLFGKTPTYPTVNVARRGSIGNPNLGIFIGLPTITPDKFEAIAKKVEAQDSSTFLPAGADATVAAGYKKIVSLWTRAAREKNINWFQLMFSGLGGAPQNMHPFSRGSILIDPENPEAEPIVDYNAMANPVDAEIFVEIIKFMRRFAASDVMKPYEVREGAPGASVATDTQLDAWIRSRAIPSVYHPVGTAAKMPRELGGVVDEDLLVYGVKNLSVIDASIIPSIPGTTTSMTVYAIAEKAADIIKARQ